MVIGASAGGVTALSRLVAGLPADFDAAVFVVQHVSANVTSLLPEILTRSGRLPAVHPRNGDSIKPGRIYIAPPDHHLLLEEGRILVAKGPKENRFRPSIDALFRSAAYTYGPRVVGVVLTGLLDDGTSGMWSVKRLGGVGLIQAPEDAEHPSMPKSVLEYVKVDYVVPLAQIAETLCKLVGEPVPEPPTLSPEEDHRMQTEIQTAAQANAFEMGIIDTGRLTSLTCPECHGALVSIKEGKLLRYRCHTGHAFTADALLAELSKSVEETFWSVVRGLEETVILLEQTADTFAENGHPAEAEQFRRKASETQHRAQGIRRLIFDHEQLSQDKVRSYGH